MNTLNQYREWAEIYLNGGYYIDEVVANLEVQFPDLDEFQTEDLERLVTIWAEGRGRR